MEETTAPTTENAATVHSARLRLAATGFVLGVLTWLAIVEIIGGVVRVMSLDWMIVVAGLLGAAAGATKARAALWITAGVAVGLVALIGFTPVVPHLMPGLIRSDPLRQAPVVVVLASDNDKGLGMSDEAQARVLHAYELLGQGYAPRMVLTRGTRRNASWIPAVRRQMEAMGLPYPVDETDPVENTHDEAVEVARLAREKGWSHVLLVTQPWHMRRAAAVLEKAGVQVVCSPCPERRYNIERLDGVRNRLTAFRDWSHEAIGYWVYRRRGWI